jgi:uncharacterized phiE125 gp8 family phage protein
MKTSVLTRPSLPLFELGFIKSYLKISTKDDYALLQYFLSVATEWVENELNKSLLTQKRYVSHRNNCFCLPYGPVIKIEEVKYHHKVLKEDEYTLIPKQDSVIIQVPFHWKSPVLEVTYVAGFGDNPEDVPLAMKHAVLGTIKYLYDHDGDMGSLEDCTLPWLKSHRTYSLGG